MAEYNKDFDMSLTPNKIESLNAEKQNLMRKQSEAVGNTADPNRYTASQNYASRISDIDRELRSLTISNEVRDTAPGPLPQTSQTSLLSQYTGATMPDAEKIRQQEIERQNLAAQTQALNTLYDEQLAAERQKFAGFSGQQRAIASRGGILSTPRDEAQQISLADRQRRVEGAINAERATKIAELTDRVNQRANERLQAERAFATSERDKYLATLKESQALARQDIAAFAQGGGSLTDLTTEQYQKLLKDTGMDDFALKATVNINNPKSKAQFTSVGDKLVGYYVNPKTGQFETFESAQIPGLSGAGGKYTIKETTKGLLAIPEKLDPTKSLDDQIKVYDSGTDYTAKSGTSSDQYTLGPEDRRYDAKGNLIAEGAAKVKEPKIVKVDGVDYQLNTDGTYTKPTVPTGSSVQKVEQMKGIVDKINTLLSTDDWKAGVGPVSANLPDWASGKRNAAIASIEEIIANIAIDNLDKLKGPMSDKDIQFIKDASAGLRTNIDEESFKKKIESIRDKLKEKIANPAVTQSQTTQPGQVDWANI